MKKYMKIIIAGITFPSILLPLILLIAWAFEKTEIFTIKSLHFLPLVWGIWNILYFTWFLKFLPKNTTLRLLITGGALGLFVALYGVFVLNIPMVIGLPKSLSYLPLVIGPILYAICWLFIINPLNHLLGVYEEQVED